MLCRKLTNFSRKCNFVTVRIAFVCYDNANPEHDASSIAWKDAVKER